MDYRIVIEKDGSGKTYAYDIVGDDGISILSSDGWENPDTIVKELEDLKNALVSCFSEKTS